MPRVRLIIPACNEAASIEAALLSHLATDYPAVNARQHVALHFSRTLDDLKRSFEKGGFAIVGRYSLARLTDFALSLPVLELGPFTGRMPVGVACNRVFTLRSGFLGWRNAEATIRHSSWDGRGRC